MLHDINKLSVKLNQRYLPNKLIFGTYFTDINFNVYFLCFYFLVIQFYDCDLNKDLY